MTEQLSDENRHFFKLGFKRSYYIDELEKYIKRLIENPNYFNINRFIIDNDSDDETEYDSDGFPVR